MLIINSKWLLVLHLNLKLVKIDITWIQVLLFNKSKEFGQLLHQDKVPQAKHVYSILNTLINVLQLIIKTSMQ
jgi:hypothetical protein